MAHVLLTDSTNKYYKCLEMKPMVKGRSEKSRTVRLGQWEKQKCKYCDRKLTNISNMDDREMTKEECL